DVGACSELPSGIAALWNTMLPEYDQITELAPKSKSDNAARHLGTLGTGNHFIEVCLDEQDRVWVMLHSGSRGAGNRIGQWFIAQAKKDRERWFIQLADKNLAYIVQGSKLIGQNMKAVHWAQSYARLNREIMLNLVLGEMSKVFKD